MTTAKFKMVSLMSARRLCLLQSRIGSSWCVRRPFCRPVETGEDGSPGEVHTIYEGLLTRQVKAVKTFSIGTSMMGIAMQPMIYQQLATAQGTHGALLAAASVVSAVTIFTPLLIHLITRRYVTQIVYDPSSQRYTATVYTVLLTRKQVSFKVEDVSVPEVPGAFTSFVANGTPLFCAPGDFIRPEHYGKFMGYDKPIDFRLGPAADGARPPTGSDAKSPPSDGA